MFSSRIAEPHHLAVMAEALSEHCCQHGISIADEARKRAAQRILAFFQSGIQRPEDYRFLLAHG